jgi:hypothetical protein
MVRGVLVHNSCCWQKAQTNVRACLKGALLLLPPLLLLLLQLQLLRRRDKRWCGGDDDDDDDDVGLMACSALAARCRATMMTESLLSPVEGVRACCPVWWPPRPSSLVRALSSRCWCMRWRASTRQYDDCYASRVTKGSVNGSQK